MANEDQHPSELDIQVIAKVVIIVLFVIAVFFILCKIVYEMYHMCCRIFTAACRAIFSGWGLSFMVAMAGLVTMVLLSGPPYFEFEAYSLEPALNLSDALSLNSALNNGERLFEGEIKGPESLAVYNNVIYTGLATGEIIAFADGKMTVVADLLQPCRGSWDHENCGRPLGLSFDKQGNLWVADAYYGIYKVNVSSGSYSLVVSSSKPIVTNETLEELPLLPNAITVASDGMIYWSDSSTNVQLHNILVSILGDKSGRLIRTNPKTGKSQVLMSGLRFSNGVFLPPDESYIAVAESMEYRIHRYWLKGPKKGQSEVFVDKLPGFPDNLSPAGDGGFIINLVQKRDFLSELLPGLPTLRKLIAASIYQIDSLFQKIDEYYPSEFNKVMMSKIGHYSLVADFLSKHSIAVYCNKDGNILKSLHSTDGSVPCVSDMVTLGGYYYIGSAHNAFLGRTKV